jgi:hypothetical protein
MACDRAEAHTNDVLSARRPQRDGAKTLGLGVGWEEEEEEEEEAEEEAAERGADVMHGQE